MRLGRKRIPVEEGDTVASALYRAGIRTFSRSLKYHRRRGLYCGTGECPNCLLTVDGVPGVRSCVTPALEGMRLRREHGWPSVERDALSILDRLHVLLPVGFYYKTFIHPRWLLGGGRSDHPAGGRVGPSSEWTRRETDGPPSALRRAGRRGGPVGAGGRLHGRRRGRTGGALRRRRRLGPTRRGGRPPAARRDRDLRGTDGGPRLARTASSRSTRDGSWRRRVGSRCIRSSRATISPA